MTDIVLFGDNSDRPNYGCRATSVALSQLLRSGGAQVRSFHSTFEEAEGVGARYGEIRETGVRRKRSLAPSTNQLSDWLSVVGVRSRSQWTSDKPKATLARLRLASRFVPKVAKLLRLISASDALVINGEGSLIFTTPPRQDLHLMLALAVHARESSVPVHFVNTGVSPCSEHGDNLKTIEECFEVLETCHSVLVREPLSLSYLRERGYGGDNARLVPDALFTWSSEFANELATPPDLRLLIPFGEDHALERVDQLKLTEPYICMSAASVAPGNTRGGWLETFASVAASIQESLGVGLVLVVPDVGDGFLTEVGRRTGCPTVSASSPLLGAGALLANASVYVSGRYHPSIMASIGGTPLIMFSSNSHKGEGLIQLLGANSAQVPSVQSSGFEGSVLQAVSKVLTDDDRAERHRVKERASQLGYDAKRAYDDLVAGAAAEGPRTNAGSPSQVET